MLSFFVFVVLGFISFAVWYKIVRPEIIHPLIDGEIIWEWNRENLFILIGLGLVLIAPALFIALVWDGYALVLGLLLFIIVVVGDVLLYYSLRAAGRGLERLDQWGNSQPQIIRAIVGLGLGLILVIIALLLAYLTSR